MSNAVFPTLPGLKWGVKRTPIWKTLSQESASGKEMTAALMTYPLRKYSLSYELLRAGALAELEQLEGFFNARNGKHDTFLYSDPDDYTITDQSFGTGNGTQTVFYLARTRGGFTEPVQALNGAPSIDKTDWQGKVRMSTSSRINVLKRSEDFSHATWAKDLMLAFGAGSVADAANAPNGDALVADLLVPNTSNGVHQVRQTLYLNLGVTYTASVFYKDGGYPDIDISAFEVTPATPVAVTVTTVPLAGGWYRKMVTFLVPADGDGAIEIQIKVNNGATNSFAGDGVAGVYLWGGHCEMTGLATSYIKTLGSYALATDYSISATGAVTLAVAPATGAALTWTGSYYWRCRFLQDLSEFDQFLKNLWQLGKLEFRTVKQ